jgi:hypothetical protein
MAVEIPILTQVFLSPVSAGVRVTTPGVDKEKISTAAAGIGDSLLISLMLPVKGIESASGGDNAYLRSDLGYGVKQGLVK